MEAMEAIVGNNCDCGALGTQGFFLKPSVGFNMKLIFNAHECILKSVYYLYDDE